MDSNGSITLTDANTSYTIPSSPPSTKYTMIIYNNSDTDVYIGYGDNNSNGILLESDEIINFKLGANQSIYAYCLLAGKTLIYSYSEIN
jgi:hypothetical protein